MVILETIENKNLRPRVQSSSDGDSITSVASVISCLTMSLNSNIALDDEIGEGKEQQTDKKDSSIEEESDDDDEYDDSSDNSSEESDDSDESEANNNFMIPVVSSPKYELLSSLSKMFMEPKESSQAAAAAAAAAATEQQTRHTNNINNNNLNDAMKRPYNTLPEDDNKKHTNRSKLIREQQQRRTARYINSRLSPPANLLMMGGLVNHHHPYDDNNKYISPPPMRLSNSFGSIRFSPPTASSSQAQQARLSSSLPSFKTSSSSSTNMSIHTNTNNYNSALKLPHYTNTLAVQQAQQAQQAQAQAQAHHKRNLSDTRHPHSIKQKQEYYNINTTTTTTNNNNNTVDSSHSSSHSSNPQESDNANTTSTVIKQKPFTSTKTITKTATATATTTNKYNKSSSTKPPTNLLLLRRTESCPSFLPPASSSQHHRRSSHSSQTQKTQDVEKNLLEEFELTLTPSQQNAKDLNAQGTSHFNNGSLIESLKSYGEALKVVKSEITTIHEGCEDDFFSEDEGDDDGSYHHVFNHHYYYSVESAILICTSLIGMGVVHWKNSKNNHYGGVTDSTTRDELSDAIHSLQEALFTLEKQKDYGSQKEMTISRRLLNAAAHNIDEAAKMCLFLSCKISALMNLGIVHLLKVSKNLNNLNDINITTNNDNNLNVALDYFIQALDIQKQVDYFIFFYSSSSSSHFSRINDINSNDEDDDSFKINNFTTNNNTFSRSSSYSNKVAILYDLIGNVYEMQGSTKKATNKYYQGLQIKQRHLKAMVTKRKKDSTSSSYNNIESYSYSLGLSYMNLGKLNLDMYLQQQQYDDSIRKYYTIGSNFKNKRNNIKQLLQSALNLYQKAYKLMTPTPTQEEVEARHMHPFNTTTSTTEAILAHQIGRCFFFLMDYENADLYYKRAERIFSSSSSRPLGGTAVAAATVGSSKVINSLWKDMAELKIKTWRNDIEKLNQKYHQFQQTNKK